MVPRSQPFAFNNRCRLERGDVGFGPMRSPAELTELFRDRNFKVTPQRQASSGLLDNNPMHPTADVVYESVARRCPPSRCAPCTRRSTTWSDMGEIHRIDLGTGSARFDPNVEAEHHHLVCDGCGLVRRRLRRHR